MLLPRFPGNCSYPQGALVQMLNARTAGIFAGGLIGPVRVPRSDGTEIRHRKRDISRRCEIAVGVGGGFPESPGGVSVIPSAGPDEPERKETEDRSSSTDATTHRRGGFIEIDGITREERWSDLAGRAFALHQIYPKAAAMSSCFSVNFFDSFG
jgi:hypothetical protein